MANVDVRIYKREVTYQKEGVDKRAINFFIGANDMIIPVEVKYFKLEKFNGRDPSYQGRVTALSLIAEPYPEKEPSESNN